jgi:hypothetical protein
MAIKANVTFGTRDVLKTDIALNSSSVHIDQSCISCNVKVFVFRPPQGLGPLGLLFAALVAYTFVDHTSDGEAFLEDFK